MKKIMIPGIILLIITSGVIYLGQPKNLFLAAEDIDGTLLKKTKAVIYLSTTAVQYNNNGISYAIFVKEDHSAQAFQMDNLELGTMAVGDNQLLLADKYTVRIVGDKMKTFQMKTSQHTGERTGYLPSQNTFFSIYNSGFDPSGSYRSDVYFGNRERIHTGTIPQYILTSGATDEAIYVLTQEFDTKTLTLKEVTLDKELTIHDITALHVESFDDSSSTTPILVDKQYYYLPLSTINIKESSENIEIYRINKQTGNQEKFPFINYENVNLASTIPYNTKNSATIYQNKLFYVDGLGDIYTFDLTTNKTSKAFQLKEPAQSSIRHNEQTYFKDGYLYVLRYSKEKKNYYYLETYSLDTGKLIDSFDIHGLDKILNSQRKEPYSYDLKVLQ
ncbi:hypothetical protein [Lysinibacillus piscis]|uniref:DUF5050 domain-containing protein n=1 Tax=Lysinibacillus piscis TaxID=2518931 RepID=A0ABQ5NQF8_9BACI|nr:hypothetical protein [Lysinibacillus sp. KH24]GLC90557.1 hypothetical protein LYSBPC_36840 [Lysinibacillus sp. KH24]